jgi:hypothetical protein
MFMVNETEAERIRDAYQQRGERAAAEVLRECFPGLPDNENTLLCARTIASWLPTPAKAAKRVPPRELRKRRNEPAAE